MMEKNQLIRSFETGRLVLRKPCTADRDAMDELSGGNRYCHTCQKVVYNLAGKSEAEIKSLFQSNAGKLCGAIPIERARPKPRIALSQAVSRPMYWKQIAATASLLLLYQGMMAAPDFHGKKAHSTQTTHSSPALGGFENTMVSAVITNQDGEEISLDFQVAIFVNKALMRRTTAHHGLLKFDLSGLAGPDDMVTIIIARNSAHDEDAPGEKVIHGGIQKTIRLRDAQNIALQVQYTFPSSRYLREGEVIWDEN